MKVEEDTSEVTQFSLWFIRAARPSTLVICNIYTADIPKEEVESAIFADTIHYSYRWIMMLIKLLTNFEKTLIKLMVWAKTWCTEIKLEK